MSTTTAPARTASGNAPLCTWSWSGRGGICGVPAITHAALDTPNDGLTAQLLCLFHLSTARLAGILRGRHAYRPGPCDWTATLEARGNVADHWTATERANA